jgi:hypothetical protein
MSLPNRRDIFIIDNFLDPVLFSQLAPEQQSLHESSRLQRWSLLSEGKTTISHPDLSQYPASQELINQLTSTRILEYITTRLNLPAEVIPLSRCTERQGHSFFHRMVYPSFLSTHVDRSYLLTHDRSLIKVANAIFMISPNWHEEDGGHTFIGAYHLKQYIEYRPNRLIIFKHTSTTFHGVQSLASSSPSRYTAYMDYYLPVAHINQLNKYRRAFWKHETVYLPEPGSLSRFFSVKHYLGDLLKYFFGFFGIYRFTP